MSGIQIMKGGCSFVAGVLIVFGAFASPVLNGATKDVVLDHIEADIHNQPSLQRGLGLFMNYCLGCHTLNYARYERTAQDIGLALDVAEEHLLVGDIKIGDLMTNTMRDEDAMRWFGKAPPDLTLFARVRGADYLYTYLRSFYRDTARPFGVNNKVFPSVGMPHALLDLQGLNECVPATAGDGHGSPDPCAHFETVVPGSMSAEEYDEAVYDLVNFLVYVSEPAALVRYRMGLYVMLFLVVMLVMTWLLKREYWKDIH